MLEAGNNCASTSCEYSASPVSGSRTTTPDVAPSRAGSSRIASMSSTRSASRACSSTVSARASWAVEGTRGISGTVTSTAVAIQARSRPRRWLSGVERWGATGVMKLLPVVGVEGHEGNRKQRIPLLPVHDRLEDPSGQLGPEREWGPFPIVRSGEAPAGSVTSSGRPSEELHHLGVVTGVPVSGTTVTQLRFLLHAQGALGLRQRVGELRAARTEPASRGRIRRAGHVTGHG